MHLKHVLIFLLLFSLSYAFSEHLLKQSSCSSNSECNYPNGNCLHKKCVCRLFYDGNTCEEDWRKDKPWLDTFIVYSVWEIILQTICFIFASWQLYVTFKYSHDGNWARWSITTYILVVAIISAFIRIVDFAVDPHHYRNIIHPIADEFLFTIPILMWVGMGFMLFLYWIELQAISGIQELLFISKYRTVLIVIICVCSAAILPLAVWRFVTNNPLSQTLYNGFFIIVLFILLVLLTGAGGNLIRVIRITYRSLSTAPGMKTFLSQLLKYIITLDAIFFISILTLFLYQFLGAETERWTYVTLHWIIRTEEFGIVFASLWFIRKRRPPPKPESESHLPTRNWSTSVNKSQDDTPTNQNSMELSGRDDVYVEATIN